MSIGLRDLARRCLSGGNQFSHQSVSADALATMVSPPGRCKAVFFMAFERIEIKCLAPIDPRSVLPLHESNNRCENSPQRHEYRHRRRHPENMCFPLRDAARFARTRVVSCGFSSEEKNVRNLCFSGPAFCHKCGCRESPREVRRKGRRPFASG